MSNNNDYGTNEDEEEEDVEVEEEVDVDAEVNSVNERLTIFKKILLYAFFIVIKVAIIVYLNASILFFITYILIPADLAADPAADLAAADLAAADPAADPAAPRMKGGGNGNNAAPTDGQFSDEDIKYELKLENDAEIEAEKKAELDAKKEIVEKEALKLQSTKNKDLTELLNKLFSSDKNDFSGNIFVTCGSRTIYEDKVPDPKDPNKKWWLWRLYDSFMSPITWFWNLIYGWTFGSAAAGKPGKPAAVAAGNPAAAAAGNPAAVAAGKPAAVAAGNPAAAAAGKPAAAAGVKKGGGGSGMVGGAPGDCDNGNMSFEARIKVNSYLKKKAKEKSNEPSYFTIFINYITAKSNSNILAIVKDYFNLRLSEIALTNIECNIWIKNRIVAWNNSMKNDWLWRDYFRYFLIVFGIILSILYLIVLDLCVNLKFIYNYFRDVLWLGKMKLNYNTTTSDKEKNNLTSKKPLLLMIFMILGMIPIFFLNSVIALFIMIQKAYYLWLYPFFYHKKEIAKIISEYKTQIAYVFVFSYLLLLYTIPMPKNYELPIKILPTLIVIIVLFVKLIKFIMKIMGFGKEASTADAAATAAANNPAVSPNKVN